MNAFLIHNISTFLNTLIHLRITPLLYCINVLSNIPDNIT